MQSREQSADDRMKRALETEYENSRAKRQAELEALLSGRPAINSNNTDNSK